MVKATNFIVQAQNAEKMMFENYDKELRYANFIELCHFNEMNQYHNCIQGGKYGWKEGAD